MAFQLTSEAYAAYLEDVYHYIHNQKDYITDLDLATGDGDHWANLNMGFEKLMEAKAEISALPPEAAFKKIGMVMMSTIGGSSGVLYGGAYLAASKTLAGKAVMDREALYQILLAMLEDMKARGKAEVGAKTMIDALSPAVEQYRLALEAGADDASLLKAVSEAAIAGAEATRAMEAQRGRASYQADKGVGHLDPGAVTMSYQIDRLCQFIEQHAMDAEE